MTAAEFIDLVRDMRKLQKHYNQLGNNDVEKKLLAQQRMIQLQREVDNAEIEDPCNLEVDFPKSTGIDG